MFRDLALRTINTTVEVLHAQGRKDDPQALLNMCAALIPDANVWSLGGVSGAEARGTADDAEDGQWQLSSGPRRKKRSSAIPGDDE
jgi:hypothetical protein